MKVALYARKEGVAEFAYSLGPGQLAASTWTDDGGRFRFRGLAAGDYTLVASKQGYSGDRIDPGDPIARW